ncbi:MAG: hypothetical protein ACOCT0_05610 [Halobacteriota archaeon]
MRSEGPGDGTMEVTIRDSEGRLSRRGFFRTLALSSTLMVVVLVASLTLGLVGSVLGAGLGGFVASFGHVDATGAPANIDPVLADAEECPEAPQMETRLEGTATISEGLTIYKDLPLPGDNLTGDNVLRFDVSSADQDINITELGMRMTAFNSETVEFREATVGERTVEGDGVGPVWRNSTVDATGDVGPDNESRGEFSIGADDGAVIVNGTAMAYMVAFSSIDVPAMTPGMTVVNRSMFEEMPAANPMEMDEVTCGALADESGPDVFDDYPDA